MFVFAAVQRDGLTFGEVIRDLPHDASALVVYVLVFAFIGFIAYGSRRPSGPDTR